MIISKGKALDFAPQALGEVTGSVVNSYFYADQGISLLNRYATYAALYRCQPSVATLADKVSNAAARLTLKVWDPTPKTGKVADISSGYARLIARPSTNMSTFNFYRWTFATYEVFGEAFWYKVRDSNGRVVELLPMHPSRTAVHRSIEGEVEYIFTLGVGTLGILHAPASDVVAFLRYNPETLMRGLSRLEPLRSTLQNEDAARRANASWWTKGARPSMILTHPNQLSQDAMDRIKTSFDARHAGADNMGSAVVLQEGMTAVASQLNAEEMQYIESRKLNMQEACMVFDVPPPVVHILDHATFSNITEQMRSMYRDTMSPRLEDFESVLDFSLRPEFFNEGQREARFDMDEVLRGDFEVRVTSATSLRQGGDITGNEARGMIGFPLSTDSEMDKLYANSALVPLGTPAQRVSITEAVTPDPAEAGAAASAAGAAGQVATDTGKSVTDSDPYVLLRMLEDKLTERAIMGRLSRKSTKAEIRKALVLEHQTALSKFFDEQRTSVKGTKAAGSFDPEAWNADLAKILRTLGQASAQAIGQKVAAQLGGKYSSDDIEQWLEDNSLSTAKQINQATKDEIVKAFEEQEDGESSDDVIDGVFDGEVKARTQQISLTRVAVVAGLAALVAARLSDAKTKTWVVTSGKPRPSHAEMSGETVLLGENFSNGMNGPGDYSGGADEVAGCTCDLDFSTEG